MNQYIEIQKKRFGRLLKSTGVNPIGAIIFIATSFVSVSYLILSSYEYARFIYPAIALYLVFTLGKSKRVQFLALCFSGKTYSKIRRIENSIVIIPFIVFLIIFSEYLMASVLLVTGLLLTKIKMNSKINWVVPTPFSKRPFEFLIGFRKTFLLFLATYVLTYISITVDNFNLGIFSFGIQFLVLTFFYLNQSEPTLYVWIHSMTPTKFIKTKLKTAITQSLLLSLPILIVLITIYPSYYLISLAILALGLLYLITAVLFKYAYYPRLSLVQEMGFLICLLTPPILPLVIPLLYARTKQNLKTILND